MIFVFVLAVLICKGIVAVRFAPETYRRFVRVPNSWQWWLVWACCNGQLLAGLTLTLLQIPPNTPTVWRGVGALAFTSGHALHLAAMVVNPHFRPEIVKPPEMCRHWLYRWLRHPGYLGLWLASLSQTLLLGYSILAPCFFGYAALLLYRTIKEERLLCRFTHEN